MAVDVELALGLGLSLVTHTFDAELAFLLKMQVRDDHDTSQILITHHRDSWHLKDTHD